MKTLFAKSSQRFSFAVMMALLLSSGALFTSCNKEDNEPRQQEKLTEEDALDVVEGAMMAGTEGLGAEVESAVYLADEYAEKSLTGNPCGETFDSTVVRSISNASLTASYTTSWEWTVLCNNANIPSALDYSRTAAGNYETARMRSDDSAVSAWNIGNLILGDNYVLDGAYTRQGSQESKVRNQYGFSSLFTMEIDELNVDKGTHQIQSGIAGFTLTLTGPEGNSQAFEGDVVFNGGGNVTIIINGNSYTIDLF